MKKSTATGSSTRANLSKTSRNRGDRSEISESAAPSRARAASKAGKSVARVAVKGATASKSAASKEAAKTTAKVAAKGTTKVAAKGAAKAPASGAASKTAAGNKATAKVQPRPASAKTAAAKSAVKAPASAASKGAAGKTAPSKTASKPASSARPAGAKQAPAKPVKAAQAGAAAKPAKAAARPAAKEAAPAKVGKPVKAAEAKAEKTTKLQKAEKEDKLDKTTLAAQEPAAAGTQAKAAKGKVKEAARASAKGKAAGRRGAKGKQAGRAEFEGDDLAQDDRDEAFDDVETEGEPEAEVEIPEIPVVAPVKSKRSARAKEKQLLKEFGGKQGLSEADREATRNKLKQLIKVGKERGYLTYVEINDHLPDDVIDAEAIESIISTFSDMGIAVYDQAPDAETLLISDQPPVVATDDDAEEEAEAALSTVDSEFGRTTDPVRMYMREMGSVELLTREGEIEIAKRIEDGLKHMVQAISACPTTIHEVLVHAEKIGGGTMRIDEVVDGLIDPNADEDDFPAPAPAPAAAGESDFDEEGDDDGDAAGRAQSAKLE